MAERAREPQPANAGEASASTEGPVWDLSDLYRGRDDARITADLAAVESEAASLAADYRGRLAELAGDELADMIDRYEAGSKSGAPR